jgi:hypothetical protein
MPGDWTQGHGQVRDDRTQYHSPISLLSSSLDAHTTPCSIITGHATCTATRHLRLRSRCGSLYSLFIGGYTRVCRVSSVTAIKPETVRSARGFDRCTNDLSWWALFACLVQAFHLLYAACESFEASIANITGCSAFCYFPSAVSCLLVTRPGHWLMRHWLMRRFVSGMF